MSPNPHGRKPKNGTSKGRRLELRLNESEYSMIENLATKHNVSKSELILIAVKSFEESAK